MRRIILDLEFTGLDNDYIKDNEIISLSWLDMDTGEKWSYLYGATRSITTGASFITWITDEKIKGLPLFSAETFFALFDTVNCEFYGFGNSTDQKMLGKYGIWIDFVDLQWEMRKNTQYEEKMALEGCSFECCYFYATGKKFQKLHSETNEVEAMFELYNKLQEADASVKKDFISIVPFGRFAGMSIEQVVLEERRFADGYRYNNNDPFADALSMQMYYNEEEDDDDDYDF